MKTYYGQMTKEQLNKTYFVPKTLEDMNAFIDMCVNAGYVNTLTAKSMRQIGVNYSGDHRLEWMPIDNVCYYSGNGMTQINWRPESERPTTDLKSSLSEAIAKRDKRKAKLQEAADKLEQAEKEVQRLIAELENEVESIGGISCKIAEMTKPDIPEGVDVDDPETWRAGDIAVCVIPFDDDFTEGSEYVFLGRLGEGKMFKGSFGWDIVATASKFRFVRRP